MEKASAFIYRNARPLDLARWRFHFEGGSREAVLRALSCYQNQDGGFGHALEADSWNPNSTPIQTFAAAEILREIGFSDGEHPILRGMIRYLAGGNAFDGQFWHGTVESNNEYPHAPWWHAESGGRESYNPTAYLAGVLVRFAGRGSTAYELGCRIAREAFEAYEAGGTQDEMHLVACYAALLEFLREAGEREILDLRALEEKLREDVRGCITQDTKRWGKDYVCKPSQFIRSQKSCFWEENRELADYECEFIRNTQLEDGSWEIPWSWAGYEEEWPVAKNWWKGNGVIKNMLYLREMG